MIKWKGLLIAGIVAVLFAACQKSANNSPYPQITFKSLTPDSVRAGFSEDTSFLRFDFTDGDGDLGNPDNPTYIYLIDSRDSEELVFPFPDIDPAPDAGEIGIRGFCSVAIQAAFLIPRADSLHTLHGDTVKFTTYIVDGAGNESNRFTTPELHIRP